MSTLEQLHEARDIAWHDLRETCDALKLELKRLDSPAAQELMARLSGDIHELRLLRRREVCLIGEGKEPEPEPMMKDEGGMMKDRKEPEA
jgi:hypothetical protein